MKISWLVLNAASNIQYIGNADQHHGEGHGQRSRARSTSCRWVAATRERIGDATTSATLRSVGWSGGDRRDVLARASA